MFEFFAANDGIRARSSVIGSLLAVSAAAASFAFAMPASAANVYIDTATPLAYTGGDTDPLAIGENGSPLPFSMSPYIVHAQEGGIGGIDFTVLAFCVDFTTELPQDADLQPGLLTVDKLYKDGSLADVPNFDDNAIKQAKVYNLLNLGQTLWLANAADRNLQLAAVQGAIWQVMTGTTFTFSEYGAYGHENDGLIQGYAAISSDPLPFTSTIRVLIPVEGQAQALAYAVQTAVPEPATWAMMLGGFTGMGAMLRHRRRSLAAG